MDAPQWLIEGAHQLFEWTGFGLIVGLAARGIMPGRDPNGAGATLLTGAGGAVLGCGTVALLMPNQQVSPLSPMGFVAAIAGAFCLLAFFRVMAGRVKIVRDTPSVVVETITGGSKRGRGRRSKSPSTTIIEEH